MPENPALSHDLLQTSKLPYNQPPYLDRQHPHCCDPKPEYSKGTDPFVRFLQSHAQTASAEPFADWLQHLLQNAPRKLPVLSAKQLNDCYTMQEPKAFQLRLVPGREFPPYAGFSPSSIADLLPFWRGTAVEAHHFHKDEMQQATPANRLLHTALPDPAKKSVHW